MEFILPLIYILTIWIISIIVTVFDKLAAKKERRRVRESTLLLLAALGGAGAMLATMKTIRHKTRKPKFMITLPVFFLIHIAVAAFYVKLCLDGIIA